MNNSFNSLSQSFGLTTAANCLTNYQQSSDGGNNTGNTNSGGHHHQLLYSHHQPAQQQQQQQTNSPSSNSVGMRMAATIQQFANSQFVSFAHQHQHQQTPNSPSPSNTSSPSPATSATTTYLKNVSCLQKEIESLKKQNLELQTELDKLRQAYTECQYQVMADSVKLTNYYEQLQQMQKDKLEDEKAYKELKIKYDEKFGLFRQNHHQTAEERSLFCDECNFEVKSQVALFIHKLNHYFEQSIIPRHLQLSTRSFSTMPDDSIRFKYKCHCCEIDAQREFQRHEIYMHIYQFHTFDIPFKCKFCFLYFTSKSYLNDHLVEKHSLPNRQGKNNRRSRGGQIGSIHKSFQSGTSSYFPDEQNVKLDQPTPSDQLNSTLSLSARTHPLPQHQSGGLSIKRSRPDCHQQHQAASGTSDINELFQQLVGETLDPSNDNQSVAIIADTLPQPQSSTTYPPPSSTSKTLEKMKRDAEIQQIMNDLDGDDSLICKYPGCKFVATTKNHLKFHISAHLMSKYKCPYCTFVGNRIVEIKRHILKSSKHTDQHVFLCPGCDFASDCEKTFRDHYSKYHNSSADVTAVIEGMFLNESNRVGQTMISAFSAANQNQNNRNSLISANSNNSNFATTDQAIKTLMTTMT